MVLKKILIDGYNPAYTLVAVVSDAGVLVDLFCEEEDDTDLVGNIYLARVSNAIESISAYFVDFGREKNAFLPFSSCNRQLKEGDMVHVQVRKNERGNKGAKVSCFIKLVGRYNMYMPNGDKDSEGPSVNHKGLGSRSADEELNALKKLWKRISAVKSSKPILLHQEHSLIGRMLRDRYATDELEILVEGDDAFHKVSRFVRELMIKVAVVQHLSQVPLLAEHGVFDQLRQAISGSVRLPSGGSIVIDSGEAMTCIDVNSGSHRGEKSIEETSYRVNLEAAAEAARQIRLRDLSGLLAIDFIDMNSQEHIESVQELFRQEVVGAGEHQMRILGMNEFCVLMLSRQRINKNLHHFFYSQCSVTKGFYRSKESMAFEIMFEVRLSLITTKADKINVECPENVAEYLLNECRGLLYMLELRSRKKIFVKANNALVSDFRVDPKHVYMPPPRVQKPQEKPIVAEVIRKTEAENLLKIIDIPKNELEIQQKSEFLLPMGFFPKPYLTICTQDRVLFVDTT